MDSPEYWKTVLWTDESKIELFGLNENHYAWRQANTAFQLKNLIPAMTHRGWQYYGLGLSCCLGVQDGLALLMENVRVFVHELKLDHNWVIQQDNDPKHTSTSTKKWLKQNKCNLLEWPDHKPIKAFCCGRT